MNPAIEVRELVAAFTAELAELAKREAIRQVASALGVQARSGGSGAPGPRGSAKRTTEELDEVKVRVLEYVAANPGVRAEEINAALGTSTKELARPVRQLVASRAIRTEGERRGTRYFKGSGKRTKRRKKAKKA